MRAFTRVITLSRGVREHLAYCEARGNLPDERHFERLTMVLRVPREAAEEIVLASMVSYERKRREALGKLAPQAPTIRRSG